MVTSSKRLTSAFTIVELMVVVVVIGILAGIVTFGATTIQKSSRDSARDAQVQIIANSLEKYYRNNGEYPSVAAMTSSDTNALKQKLGITNATVFKLPLANSSVTNSIATSSPSASTLVYSANTTDATKNSQCQTDVNGYCDGFTLAYVKEASGSTQTVQSLNTTFQSVKSQCDAGDTQSGSTCTHTYAGTYQAGAYTCPSGGTLSGTTCTRTYAASYSPPSSGYYCPSGGSLNGTTCTTSSSYPATYTTTCPSGYSYDAELNRCQNTYASSTGGTGCAYVSYPADGFPGAHYICTKTTTPTSGYTCPSGGTLSGTTCNTSGSYAASYYSYSGYYYCSGSDTLSGSTCTNTYTATQGTGYYTCPSGGVASGSSCSYTYQLQG